MRPREVSLSNATADKVIAGIEEARAIVEGKETAYDGAYRIWALTLLVPAPKSHELDTFIYGASGWQSRPEERPIFEEKILAAARDLVRD
jgi:hypothetical protein